jgi:hypothetical protein
MNQQAAGRYAHVGGNSRPIPAVDHTLIDVGSPITATATDDDMLTSAAAGGASRVGAATTSQAAQSQLEFQSRRAAPSCLDEAMCSKLT